MIRFKNVYKSFDKDVIKDLNFQIKKGEKIALVGSSGIGKTTIVNLILGIEIPDRGEIDNSFKKISVVFQENRLIDELSPLDNLKMISEEDEEKLIDILKELGIDDFNKKVSSLSGGMKRRVSLARGIFFGGDLLILDEPIQGLDEENRKLVIKKILKNYEDKSILLITHNINDIKDFMIDRVINIR